MSVRGRSAKLAEGGLRFRRVHRQRSNRAGIVAGHDGAASSSVCFAPVDLLRRVVVRAARHGIPEWEKSFSRDAKR